MAENKKDLLPFYKSRTGLGNGTFFNSDDSRTTEVFGYIYDDFVGIKDGDIQALRKQIDEKYVWASRTPVHPNFTDPQSNMRPLNVRSTYFFSKTLQATTQLFAMTSGPATSSTNGENIATDAGKADFASVANTVTSRLQAVAEAVPAHVQKVIGIGRDTMATPLASTKIDSKFDREWYVDSVVNR